MDPDAILRDKAQLILLLWDKRGGMEARFDAQEEPQVCLTLLINNMQGRVPEGRAPRRRR